MLLKADSSEVARSELGAGLGLVGAPQHPEDGPGGPGFHSLQLTALLPPHAAGVGTVPVWRCFSS